MKKNYYITAIVLAAGLSSRMKGKNKMLMSMGKDTLLRSTLKNIKQSNVNEIILILGSKSKQIEQSIEDLNIRNVYNENFKKGLSESIKKGIENLDKKTTAVLICLGDMPFITKNIYNQLISYYKKNNSKLIIQPTYQGIKGNPVLFSSFFFKNLLELTGDKGAKDLIKSFNKNVLHFEFKNNSILKDIDEKKDLINII